MNWAYSRRELTEWRHVFTGFVHGQKRFLGDIAQELSAPVARIHLRSEFSNSGRSLAPWRTCATRYSKCRALVVGLLSFSKAGMQTESETPRENQWGRHCQ